ncbi:hypothetical protein JCM11251_001808 [Rhodosporidiobolus azoricus]
MYSDNNKTVDPTRKLESEDNERPEAHPPPEYFSACRDLFPSSTRRDALRAWDRTTGIGSGGDSTTSGEDKAWEMSSVRVQAALGPLLNHSTTFASGSDASPAASPPQPKRPRPPSSPLFDVSSPLQSRPSPCMIDLSSTPPPAKRARPSNEQVGSGRVEKVKGKAPATREIDLLVGDLGEEQPPVEADLSVEIVRAGKKRDKGKGRAISPAPCAAEFIDLADSSDIELEFPHASTSASIQAKGRKRSPSLVLPSLPTPPPSPLSQILSIIPDVLPAHARSLLESEEGAGDPEKVVGLLLDAKEYPTVTGEKKEEKVEQKDWMDVAKRKREDESPSPLYKRIALDNLYASFPLLPVPLIKSTFVSTAHGPSFFAPSYLSLHTAFEKGEYDSRKLKKPRKAPKAVMHPVVSTKYNEETGQQEAYETEEEEGPPEDLRKEMEWVRAKILKERRETRQAEREAAAAKAEEERVERLNEAARKNGQAVECQCCFDEVAPANTASCDNSHLFCKSCCAANASHQLGQRITTLPCMAPDCTAVFSPPSWHDFLPQKTINGLEKIAQEAEVGKAFEGVEGFETCPFCLYACYIENPHERLFRCERADCRKISCRKCRKVRFFLSNPPLIHLSTVLSVQEGHIPYTCEEADSDRRLLGVHAVAESMTAALIRECPKCKIATAKIDGCDSIYCQCGAHWCYVCRAPIKGYDHFNDRGGEGACPAHDDTDMRNYKEVEEARRAAEAQLDDLTRADTAKLAAEAPERPIVPFVAQAAFGAAAQGLANALHALQQDMQRLQQGWLAVPVPPQQPQVLPGRFPLPLVQPAYAPPAAVAQQPFETDQ